MQIFNKKEYKAEFIFHDHFDNGNIPHACGRRGLTFVVVFDNTKLFGVGIAECSDADQFNKKRGVLIARGRARKMLAGENPYIDVGRREADPTKERKRLYQLARDLFNRYDLEWLRKH